MKKINKTIMALFLSMVCSISIGLQSCGDYLDVDEYIDQMTFLDSVFSRKQLLEQYINGAASYLPNEGKLWSNSATPFQTASDENFMSWNDAQHYGMKFLLDEVTPYDTYFNNYPRYYQGIRMSLTALSRINEVPDVTDIERRELMGRCYFLVGYYYYLMLIQYGPVPIVPEKPFNVDVPVAEMSLERSTYDECVAEIQKWMSLAAQFLPLESESEKVVNMPTQWAAIATLSRITLYAASPWYNGNKFYADWKRTSDGANFISQQADNTKWGVAAAYSKYIIDSNKFNLYWTPRELDSKELPANKEFIESIDPDYYKNYPEGAAGIDHYRSLTYTFNGEVPVMINPEFIYSCQMPTTDAPMVASAPYQLGGWNGLNLVQDLIDAYQMVDGQDINNSSQNYPYPDASTNFEKIGGANQMFSGFTLDADAARMYNNREPRFYATIGFCHSFWPGTSSTDNNYRNKEVTYYSDGFASANADHPEDYNRTGYTCIKYMHLEDNLKATVRTKYFPIFRYAEILLNYVEAINELEAPYTMTMPSGTEITVQRNVSDIVSYFNLIRHRAGLPGITATIAADKEKIRELIKHERRIEFACEGRRYHDLRRWGDAMEAYKRPITGCNIKARSNERQKFYTTTILNDKLTRRTFSYKHYFYPIPKSVLDKNKNLVQNPEWN